MPAMNDPAQADRIDLSPAQWIWFPSQRTLANTFVLFRRRLLLSARPIRATGWVTADSRYLFSVNGRRVQTGPAPCDPRFLDADPIDLTSYLAGGENVLAAQVLFYGHGDGTWPAGKPGFICRLEVERADGSRELVVTDESWSACVDRAHRPGQYKRWFVRALQEEFDARLHPYGWDTPDYRPDESWTLALALPGSPARPAVSAGYPDYAFDAFGAFYAPKAESHLDADFCLRARQIPALQETDVPVQRLAEQTRVTWLRDPHDWFDMRVPDSMRFTPEALARAGSEGVDGAEAAWELPATSGPRDGLALTFELAEQVVGWPYFTIDAADGTIVELLCQESHDPANGPWLDTQFFAWSRFICREGTNPFMTSDFESLRWLQLHIRNASRPCTLRSVGVRRRRYPWPHPASIECGEPALQRLFDAGINTLHNSAQETVVDGMARERQQYSGDVGHQLHAIRYAFGETRLPRRFLRTFSEGQTLEGYFLDCWPAYDRLARISQRELRATPWGPILDHSLQFAFDCWHHYLQTGDLDALREPYPRLLRCADYVASIRAADGLLPVEETGVPSVWIDHEAYVLQRHKRCALNLYAAAAYRHALAPIAGAFGDPDRAEAFTRLGRQLQEAAVRTFWSRRLGLFVNNLPWVEEEGEFRLDDRSLATAVLFDQCPGRNTGASLTALIDCPPNMGVSYPCNANWRYWALARYGRIDVVLKDFRERWATMSSVVLNNTLQEEWVARADSTQQWSHCALSPIYVLFMDIAGIRPLEPGFRRCVVRPQLGDLESLRLTAHTVLGPIRLQAKRTAGAGASGRPAHRITIDLPPGCEGELVLPMDTRVELRLLGVDRVLGVKRYPLFAGRSPQIEV